MVESFSCAAFARDVLCVFARAVHTRWRRKETVDKLSRIDSEVERDERWTVRENGMDNECHLVDTRPTGNVK